MQQHAVSPRATWWRIVILLGLGGVLWAVGVRAVFGAPLPCGPTESACEVAVAADCSCGGDPCLRGEYCAAAARACPPKQVDCLRLLPTTTTTTSTTTTTTLRLIGMPCRSPVRISDQTPLTYCGCGAWAGPSEELVEYLWDADGACVAAGGVIRWTCPGHPSREGHYRYEDLDDRLLPRRVLIAAANCGCVSPDTPVPCEP